MGQQSIVKLAPRDRQTVSAGQQKLFGKPACGHCVYPGTVHVKRGFRLSRSRSRKFSEKACDKAHKLDSVTEIVARRIRFMASVRGDDKIVSSRKTLSY